MQETTQQPEKTQETAGQTQQTTPETNGAMEIPPRRRKRRGKKRVVFQVPPRPAPSVKELWQHASEEERIKAHTCCAVMLEYWLGRTSKAQVGERLSVSPLRVWQLSQMAVSGMLAGLLKQPRGRGTYKMPSTPPEDDPKRLRKRIAELEQQLKLTEDLVMILREFPANRPSRAVAEKKEPEGSASRETKTPTREKKSRRARRHPGSRSLSPQSPQESRRQNPEPPPSAG